MRTTQKQTEALRKQLAAAHNAKVRYSRAANAWLIVRYVASSRTWVLASQAGKRGELRFNDEAEALRYALANPA